MADCSLCNDTGYLYRNVPLYHPGFGKPTHCSGCYKETVGMKEYMKLAEASGLTEEERRHTFQTLDQWEETKRLRKQVELWVARILEEPRGWLFLYGAYGTGKTRFGQVILNECLRAGMQGAFFEVPRLLDFLREKVCPDDGESFIKWVDQLQKITLLVLDEFGKQRRTDFGAEKLFEILNYRCERAGFLPTVLITNLTPGEIDGMDPWLRSRLENPEVEWLAFKGADLRTKRKLFK